MTLTPKAKVGVALCALLGIVISWAFFVSWGLERGLDLVGFWSDALTLRSQAATGLAWDLVASALVLTVVTVHEVPRLGWRRVGATLLATWTVGVCLGLALFFLLGRETPEVA